MRCCWLFSDVIAAICLFLSWSKTFRKRFMVCVCTPSLSLRAVLGLDLIARGVGFVRASSLSPLVIVEVEPYRARCVGYVRTSSLSSLVIVGVRSLAPCDVWAIFASHHCRRLIRGVWFVLARHRYQRLLLSGFEALQRCNCEQTSETYSK